MAFQSFWPVVYIRGISSSCGCVSSLCVTEIPAWTAGKKKNIKSCWLQQLWRNTATNRAKAACARSKKTKRARERKQGWKNNKHHLLPLCMHFYRICLSFLVQFILISVLLLCLSSPLTDVKMHRKLLPWPDFSHIFCTLGIWEFTGDTFPVVYHTFTFSQSAPDRHLTQLGWQWPGQGEPAHCNIITLTQKACHHSFDEWMDITLLDSI